jgi:hypothetical protein
VVQVIVAEVAVMVVAVTAEITGACGFVANVKFVEVAEFPAETAETAA